MLIFLYNRVFSLIKPNELQKVYSNFFKIQFIEYLAHDVLEKHSDSPLDFLVPDIDNAIASGDKQALITNLTYIEKVMEVYTKCID